MALIIDAYNVLHCSHVLPDRYAMISATDLCRLLENSRWDREAMMVVCDGQPKPEEGEYAGPVELIYSGPATDADSVIERLIERDSAPRSLTVVSNDRRLIKAARRRRARPMPAERFLQLLVTCGPSSRPSPAKPTQMGSTDDWFNEFELTAGELDQLAADLESPAPAQSPDDACPATQDDAAGSGDADPPRDAELDQQMLAEAEAEAEAWQENPSLDEPSEGSTEYWLRTFGMTEQDRDEP
jgi:hypothetical protein